MEDGKESNDLIILYCSSGIWERLRLTQAWLQWGRSARSTGDFSLSARSFSQKVDFVGWKFEVLFADFSLYSQVDYVQWRWIVMLTLWQVKSRNVFSDIGSGLKSMVSSTLKFEQSIKSIECRISDQLFK